MTRTQILLGGALVLQLALVLIVRSPFADASTTTEARAMFPVPDAFTPTKMEIHGNDEARVTLTREGGEWTIDELGSFPADATKVPDLIDDLKALTVRRPVVSSGRYHSTFKVKDNEHQGRVRIWGDDGGDASIDLILGTSPNYGITHARQAGQDEVYEISGIASYDVRADADAWAQIQLLDVDADKVTSLSVTNASGSFELNKKDGVWTAANGDTLDPTKVEGLVNSVRSMRLAGATGPADPAAHGFASPAATVVLCWTGEDGAESEATLQIGARPEGEDTKRFATRSGFDFTGTIWESSISRLLDEGLDDLHASPDVSG